MASLTNIQKRDGKVNSKSISVYFHKQKTFKIKDKCKKCHKTRKKGIIQMTKCQQKGEIENGIGFAIYFANKGFKDEDKNNSQDSNKPKLKMQMFNLKYRRLNYDAY